MDPKAFFAELKRRRVYNVAAAYVVVAWLLIQIATQVFPFFEFPNWSVRLVVLATLLGFPVAVAIAWAFEVTPEGIRREGEPGPPPPALRRTGRKLTLLVVLLASVAAGMMLFRLQRSLSEPGKENGRTAAEAVASKSIAVLPFANLSEEKANAYFAQGIEAEILTRLANVADLKVIAQSSTLHYESTPDNLPEIARQLGVAHILEGSVQKQGDEVRVNVQLIRATDDSHLWAETFDRKLTDIFAVEAEVAKAIADRLRAHLTGREVAVISARPTDDPQAYDAYLRGLAYTLKTQNTPANYLGAQRYFRDAVRLDSKFALAWALLSYVDARGYHTTNLQPTYALREEARLAFTDALALDPNLGEGWMAKGYYYYGCERDFDQALHCYERARQLLPNNGLILASLALLARDQGRWEKGETYYNDAERLDPRNLSLLTRHAQFYIALRRFPEALQKLEKIVEIAPNDPDALVEQAAIAQAQGDLDRAGALLARLRPAAGDPTAWETVVYQAILERRSAAIVPRLRDLLSHPDPGVGYLNGELRFWLGWAEAAAGDKVSAQASWRDARVELEAIREEQPENWSLLDDLALINAGLGEKAAALSLVTRAIAMNPVTEDAANGPQRLETLARVAAQVGEPDRAIAALQQLLAKPGNGALATGMPLTPALLRLDPMFDALRADPRFASLTQAQK